MLKNSVQFAEILFVPLNAVKLLRRKRETRAVHERLLERKDPISIEIQPVGKRVRKSAIRYVIVKHGLNVCHGSIRGDRDGEGRLGYRSVRAHCVL